MKYERTTYQLLNENQCILLPYIDFHGFPVFTIIHAGAFNFYLKNIGVAHDMSVLRNTQ